MVGDVLKFEPIDDRGSNLKFKVKLPSGQFALLKLRTAFTKKTLHNLQVAHDKERIALRALDGLAVPTLLDVPFDSLVGKELFSSAIGMSWFPWKNVTHRKLSFDEACGLWLFVLEQLCAFKKRQILYGDLKGHHVLVRRDFRRAILIDFDAATVVNRSGIYNQRHLVTTLSYSAPECMYHRFLKESVYVYSAAMFLCASYVKRFNNMVLNSEEWPGVRKKFTRAGIFGLDDLLLRSLSFDPEKRPQSYEALFKEAKLAIRRPRALQIWNELRTPYKTALAD